MIDSRNNELDDFKRHINLTEFATQYGFVIDTKKSTKSTVVMRDSHDYIIIISVSKNDHWQYFSPNDDADSGTIIDFVTKYEKCNLGHLRKILRQWRGHTPQPQKTWQRTVKKSIKDREKVIAYLKRFKASESSVYLEARGISENTLNDAFFKKRILQGYKDAVIFPHFNEKGVCGYEVKKQGFTSFSEFGDKTFWLSNKQPGCNKVVFFENPIEGLSFYELYPADDYFMFVSPCGNWSPGVSELIKKLMLKNKERQFVSAFNNDKGGDRQHDLLNKLMNEALGVDLDRIMPPVRGEDWNDTLLAVLGAPKMNNNN